MKNIPILCFLCLVLCAAQTMAQQNPAPEVTAPEVTAPGPDNTAVQTVNEAVKPPVAPVETGSIDDKNVGELISAGSDAWASDSGDSSYFEIETTKQSGMQKMPSFLGGRKFRRGMLAGGPRKLAGKSTSGNKSVFGIGFYSKGLGYQLGKRFDKHQVATNFMMGSDLENGDGDNLNFIGGGVSYDYRLLSAQNVFSLALGVTAGFWNEEITTREYDPVFRRYVNDFHDDLYFAGPHVRAEAGYNWIAVDYALTMLIGTNVALLYGIGIELIF